MVELFLWEILCQNVIVPVGKENMQSVANYYIWDKPKHEQQRS